MFTIKEQLEEFCDCLPEMSDSIFERNLEELIGLVSNLTCWTQQPCETLLNSERTEIIDVQEFDLCDCCEDGIMDFVPFFYPFYPETLEISIVTQKGIHEEIIELDASEFAYNETFKVVRINLRDYMKNSNCGCPEFSKLLIKYDAGYEELPKCLLQLFCDLLHVIYSKNNCDCSECQKCKGNDVVIEFDENDEISPQINVYLNRLVEAGYQKQLGLISVCQQNVNGWGVVV